LRREIVWRYAPRIWRDFGSAMPFQTRLTQTKPVLPLSNDYGSQVKDQGRRQCCHNKHKKFPFRPTRDVSLLSEHSSYVTLKLIALSTRSRYWSLPWASWIQSTPSHPVSLFTLTYALVFRLSLLLRGFPPKPS
jgi:hypothetical protein